MWQAVVFRDRAGDGRFVVVKPGELFEADGNSLNSSSQFGHEPGDDSRVNAA